MSNECIELKNIKYKSMLLSGNSEEPVETVENLSNLEHFLAGEKKNSSNEVCSLVLGCCCCDYDSYCYFRML